MAKDKNSYYRIDEEKPIHIGQEKNDIISFQCGREMAPSWHLTKCFRPNSLDSVCRGCRTAW